MSSKSDLLMHPVRISITQALTNNEPQTVQQIARTMPGVSLSTLYRHLHKLVEAGLVIVAGERQAHGAVERRYTLAREGNALSYADIEGHSKEDLLRHFTVAVTSILGDFDRYVAAQEHVNLRADGVLFGQFVLNLDDTEFAEFHHELVALLERFHQMPVDMTRKRRTVSIFAIPVAI